MVQLHRQAPQTISCFYSVIVGIWSRRQNSDRIETLHFLFVEPICYLNQSYQCDWYIQGLITVGPYWSSRFNASAFRRISHLESRLGLLYIIIISILNISSTIHIHSDYFIFRWSGRVDPRGNWSCLPWFWMPFTSSETTCGVHQFSDFRYLLSVLRTEHKGYRESGLRYVGLTRTSVAAGTALINMQSA